MHPRDLENEKDETRRVAEGFTVEADRFIHTYTHQDHLSPFPTKFIATNEESYLQGGALGQVVKKYKYLSDWELGWGVLETRQITGENGKEEAKIKTRTIAVPIEGILDYLDDCALVAHRLNRAAEELVRRYNQQKPKKVLDWKDEIWSEEWKGRGGKQEITVYEITLSTFAFFGSCNPDAVISQSDLRLNIKLRTTYDYHCGGPGGSVKGSNKIDGFRRDLFGYNTRLDHFLNLLNAPGFQKEISLARDSLHAYSQLVDKRKEAEEQVIRDAKNAVRAADVARNAPSSSDVKGSAASNSSEGCVQQQQPAKKRLRLDSGYDDAIVDLSKEEEIAHAPAVATDAGDVSVDDPVSVQQQHLGGDA